MRFLSQHMQIDHFISVISERGFTDTFYFSILVRRDVPFLFLCY